jgi:hypothetical protein
MRFRDGRQARGDGRYLPALIGLVGDIQRNRFGFRRQCRQAAIRGPGGEVSPVDLVRMQGIGRFGLRRVPSGRLSQFRQVGFDRHFHGRLVHHRQFLLPCFPALFN